MAKGVFSGVIWGAVVAAAGAGGLSLAYPDFKPALSNASVVEPDMDKATTDETAEAVDAMADDTVKEDPAVDMASTEGEEITDAEPEEAASDDTIANVDETAEAPSEVEMSVPEAEEPDESEVTEAEGEADVVSETSEPEIEQTDENAQTGENITDEIIAALPKPEGTVGDLAAAVTTDRLPSLADDAEPEADAPSAVAPPPFERFASDFNVESDKPRMAIVLIDDGQGALGVEALDAFPYPLTFAVDASKPDASERMQVYRDKGFEVLALVDLPRGANPSDVEVAMTAYLSAVPEAIGILEGVDTGVQTSREMADQLTQIILDSGHGMLLQSSGLNTARKLAEREGIPAGTVFRDFDGNGQSASVMRRFLDQAAFRAGQEGGVVMMGRLQAETISALLIWGLADRASRVALVPVSAVLKSDAADG